MASGRFIVVPVILQRGVADLRGPAAVMLDVHDEWVWQNGLVQQKLKSLSVAARRVSVFRCGWLGCWLPKQQLLKVVKFEQSKTR